MKAIVFDLDNTLFDTRACQVYLRSKAGIGVIGHLIDEGEVNIIPLDPSLPDYLNGLIENQDLDIYVFSDSPKFYCEKILSKFKINLSEDFIFGSQHKPCAESTDFLDDYENILVVGDSPKDIYFGHIMSRPSVYLTDFTEFDVKYISDNANPTRVVSGIDELSDVIAEFYQDELEYSGFPYIDYFKQVDADSAEIFYIDAKDIGYAKEYVPKHTEWRNKDKHDEWAYYDVRRAIKPAKNLTHSQLTNRVALDYYNYDGEIRPANSFSKVAWHAANNFISWANSKGLEGDIYLVPAPSSVPSECNHSFPMYSLIQWWINWIPQRNPSLKFTIRDGISVERVWPTIPAHFSGGKREVKPHFETLGVFPDLEPFPDTLGAVVILDDVVTSGTQMSAIGSLLRGVGIIPKHAKVYGYALAKTVRPGVSNSIEDLIEATLEAEKSGD